MSIEALNWAFKQKVKPSSLKFVLVALCDYASEGGEAFPSIETLSSKTSQDRKTVMKNLEKLRDLKVIFDTGYRRGATNQVVVYKVIFTGNLAEKQNSTKNGTVPFFHDNSTKNGTGKEYQKRYTEPSVINHQLEPSDIGLKSTFSAQMEKYDVDQSFVEAILKHRREIKSKKPTAKAMNLILLGMSRAVEQGLMPSMDDCLEYLITETTWQGFKPEYLKPKASGKRQVRDQSEQEFDDTLARVLGANDNIGALTHD